MCLNNQVVLVTGGARRIGAAIVRRLHERGANVAIHYNKSKNDALELQAELENRRSGSTFLVQADLLDIKSIKPMVAAVVQHFGHIDALVNNASTFEACSLADVTEEHFDEMVGTNFKAHLFTSQAAACELRRTNGCIVNIVDIHADRPMRGHMVYSAAKAGLVGLTKGLAQELAPQVRVNGVAPGPIIWPECDGWNDTKIREEIINHTLLKREGDPDDIAKAVKFLIADAPYITGQIIAVDGGRSISI